MKSYLSSEQLQAWKNHGYLLVRNMFDDKQKTDLRNWVNDLEGRPETPGKWMKYFEAPLDKPDERQLCRVENFLGYHEAFQNLLEGPKIIGMLSELMGEPAVLFKEKINFKLPGGNGFAPHQDAPAFTQFGQTYHITMMISVDPTTVENGCLEMVNGMHNIGLLPTANDLTIDPEHCKTLDWKYLPTEIGDVVFFGSFVPHRSGPNKTTTSRRVLYVTYNPASQGCYRDEYYRLKREVFPPDIERVPGKTYGNSGVFNVGNPIRPES